MQSRSDPQRELLDVESVAGHLLPQGSVFAFLAAHRDELFPYAMFADLFPSGRGRPSTPAPVVATVLVLQALHGLPDRGPSEPLVQRAPRRPRGTKDSSPLPAPLAEGRHWRQYGAMPSVQIKDVPEETHAVLRRRAAVAHQSLQEYLLAKLIREASSPTLEEVLDRAGDRAGGALSFRDAAQVVRDDRDRR